MAEKHQATRSAANADGRAAPPTSVLSCLWIPAALAALYGLAAWLGPSGFRFSARGAATDAALVAVALLLWRPLFRGPWRAALVAGVLLFVFSYGHTLKAGFLGVPITATDTVAVVALLQILDGWRLWLAVGGIAVALAALVWALWPRRGKAPWLLAGAAYLAILVALPFWAPETVQSINGDEADAVADARRIGGVLYLLKDVTRSLEELEAAPNQAEVDAALASVALLQSGGVRPRNVHVVLLETLWDPLKLSAYRFSRDPFDPRFRALLERSNGSAALSPVFGSLTANAEFEVLCGLPTTQFTVFFVSSLRKPMPCLPRVLRQAGYLSMASHPNLANFWSRDRAYGLLGFESYRAVESFVIDDLDGPYLNDASLFRQNLEALAAAGDRPVFNYVVSLSSHYPYQRDREKRPDVVHATPRVALLDAYANAAYYTTRAFMDWVERVRAQDPDAVIVAFGDHAPVLGNEPDPYRASGYPISGTGRTTPMLLPLAETPLLVVDGRRGALSLGTVPMSRLPHLILGLLGRDPAPTEAKAAGRAADGAVGADAAEDPVEPAPAFQATRFQGAVFAAEDGAWAGCNRASVEGASTAYLARCDRARARVDAGKTVRDDLARGRQYALSALDPELRGPVAGGMQVDPDRDRCLIEVGEWGPQQIALREDFNPQPDGRNAIWMKVLNRAGALSLRVGDEVVPITFGEDVGAASWRKPRFAGKAGTYPVEVVCGDGGMSIPIGALQVGAPAAAAAPVSRRLDVQPVVATPELSTPSFGLVSGECVDGRLAHATVEVDWRARPGTGAVTVQVSGPGETPILWTESGAHDSVATGPWVMDGHRFLFYDARTRRLLGEYVVQTPACASR